MLFSNSAAVTEKRSLSTIRKCDVPWKILLFMGIGNRKCHAMLFFGILTFPLIWCFTFITITGTQYLDYITIMGFIAIPTLMDFTWLILYSKRMKLKEVFERTYHSSRSCSAPVVQLLSWFTLMLAYPTLLALYCYDDRDINNIFYTLNYTKDDLGSLGVFALVLFSAHIIQLVKSNFSCSVTAIYCDLCHRCLCKILVVKRELDAKDVPLVDVLRRYQEALNTVILLEEVFSPVMLLLVIFNIMTMFTCLSVLLIADIVMVEAVDIAVTLTLNLSSLVAYTAFAAEIPIRVKKVNLKLHKIIEEMSFRPNWANERSSVEAMLLRPEVVLSACDVLYFNRGFILASIGSLFTYGVLVRQLNI